MPNFSLPLRVALVSGKGLLQGVWLKFFQTVNMAPVVRGVFDIKDRAASFAATPFATASLKAGLYMIGWYVRVQVVAGVSSDVQVTVGWTDGGVPQTKVGTLVNGNLTTSHDETSFLARVDAGTQVTVAAAYNSNPAAAMQYRANAVLVEMPLPTGAAV